MAMPSRLLGACLATALCVSRLAAGPVPGVETFDRRPVEFPTPPSIEAWDIGGDYLVTFKWTPGKAVTSPAVAGSFNGWSRTDLPMEDPDSDGTWTVTAKLGVGDFQYKFTEGADTWLSDPLNPEQAEGGYGNSILRLGITALVKDAKAARGDGTIEARAFRHNPQSHTFFDLLPPDDLVLRFQTLRNDVENAELVLVARDGKETRLAMRPAGSDGLFDFYEKRLIIDRKSTAVAYRFAVTDGAATTTTRETWPLVLDASRAVDTPEWAMHATWYQIMADRFRDGDPSNNPEHTVGSSTKRKDITHPWRADWYKELEYERRDGATFWQWSMYERLFGGDFQGIIDKLDYLKGLGVTAIYLNPVFEASNSHKYNARSYVHADDGYGVPGEYDKSVAKEDLLDASTWEFNASDRMLLRVVKEAHKRGMKVILDGVFNHLGDDAQAFLDVKEKRQASAFADWYDVVSWEPFEYRGWAGFGGLPQFRKDGTHGLASESLREHIYAVTRRWLDPNGDGDPSDGIDGWRLDVPGDVPMPFWVEWRKVVKETNPEAYISGEIWGPAEEWLDGRTFDAVMNYPFATISLRFFANKEKKITATQFDAEMARHRIRYPRAATYVLQNLYDSHDTDRLVSRIANPDMDYDGGNRIQDSGPNYMDEKPAPEHYQRLRLMAMFQATYVGAPMIWYGTEAGMFGADDPMCRMPMWWDDMMPYDNPDYRVDTSLRDEFRSLFRLRKDHRVLRTGDYATLLADDAADAIVFLRYDPRSKYAFVVALNNSASPQRLAVPAPDKGTLGRGFRDPKLVHGDAKVTGSREQLVIELPPVSGAIVRINP